MSINLTIGNKFTPFSFEEKLKPFMLYKEEYDKVDNDFTTLMSQAEVWKDRAMRDKNPEAYRRYKRYMDDLSTAVDSLRTSGTINKSALQKLKARYAGDITPIETAAKRQEMLADEQRKAELANPTMLWQRRASDMSIDDFIKNPEADYGSFYSGALLTQQVATKATALAKELSDPGERGKMARARLQQILPYQYRLLEKRGFNSSEVLKTIMQDPDASPILTNLVDSTLDSAGINNWADNETKQKARAYANEGLWNAIGSSEYKYVTDQAGLEAYKSNLELQRQRQVAKDKEKDDALNQIALGSHSYLKTSGMEGKLKGIIGKLFSKKGFLNADYYGKKLINKDGKSIDPIKVYEEATKAYKQAYGANIEVNYGGNSYYSGRNTTNAFIAADKAKSAVMKKYGVTKLITDDEYKALKKYGFNIQFDRSIHKNQGALAYNFSKAIDKTAAEMSYYSTAMDDYSLIESTIKANLYNANEGGNFSGLVYRLNADGTIGKGVSYKDLGIDPEKEKSAPVKDIAYSAYTPDKIIVTMEGKKYLMDPSVLGGNYVTLLNTARAALAEGASPDIVTMNTTAAMVGHLKAFNSLKGK